MALHNWRILRYIRPGYNPIELDNTRALIRSIKIKKILDVNKHNRQKEKS